jgi:hypothetical protein
MSPFSSVSGEYNSRVLILFSKFFNKLLYRKMAIIKERKVSDQNHTYNRLTEGYFFTCIIGADICIICNDDISISK